LDRYWAAAAASAGPDPAPRRRLTRPWLGRPRSARLDDAAARTRIKDLIPEGASVFTAASETLRLSGIDEDINTSERYQAVKPLVLAMDRVTSRRPHWWRRTPNATALPSSVESRLSGSLMH
jgi:hypothetical protein